MTMRRFFLLLTQSIHSFSPVLLKCTNTNGGNPFADIARWRHRSETRRRRRFGHLPVQINSEIVYWVSVIMVPARGCEWKAPVLISGCDGGHNEEVNMSYLTTRPQQLTGA
jgi:hypothetical protein